MCDVWTPLIYPLSTIHTANAEHLLLNAHHAYIHAHTNRSPYLPLTIHHTYPSSFTMPISFHSPMQRVGVMSLEVTGDKLISGGDDSVIRIWNTNNWTCEQILRAHQVCIVCERVYACVCVCECVCACIIHHVRCAACVCVCVLVRVSVIYHVRCAVMLTALHEVAVAADTPCGTHCDHLNFTVSSDVM